MMCKKEEAEANSILSTTAFSQSRSILCVFGSFVINGLRSGPIFTDTIKCSRTRTHSKIYKIFPMPFIKETYQLTNDLNRLINALK